MGDRLLVFPAGASYVGNLRAARRAGYKVITIDRDPAAPGFAVADHAEAVDITDVNGVLRVAREQNVAGIVPLNDYAVPTAARVAEMLSLVGLDPTVAEVCTNKASMRREWAEAGLPQPEFALVESLEEAERVVERIGLPVICKPAVSTGGGSRGVSVVDDQSRLAEAVEFAQSPYDDDGVLIEAQVIGSEHSVEVVIHDGDASALVVSDKEKTPEPYRVDKSVIYPTSLNDSTRGTVERICEDATTALNIDDGAAHVELGVTADGPRLFELGARCGGGATAEPIVRAVTGIDYFVQLCHLYADEDVGEWIPCRQYGAVYRFLTPEPGTLESVKGVEEVLSWEGVLDCRVYLSPGDNISPVRVGGDRTGAVITNAPSREEAIRIADKAERTIRFEYE